MAAIRSEVDVLKVTVTDMEGSLSTCTDDVLSLQSKVVKLSTQLVTLDSKCEELEARSRRNNIRIIGLPEEIGGVDATTVFDLLKPWEKSRWWTGRIDPYSPSRNPVSALVL